MQGSDNLEIKAGDQEHHEKRRTAMPAPRTGKLSKAKGIPGEARAAEAELQIQKTEQPKPAAQKNAKDGARAAKAAPVKRNQNK